MLTIQCNSQMKSLISKSRVFFYSQDSWENINKGLKLIYQGEHWLTRDLLVQSLHIVRKKPRNRNVTDRVNLTKRETEILSLIAAGLTNRDIAEKLYISFNTVKTHVGNIFKKIGVSNRVQAILWVAENLSSQFLDGPVENRKLAFPKF